MGKDFPAATGTSGGFQSQLINQFDVIFWIDSEEKCDC